MGKGVILFKIYFLREEKGNKKNYVNKVIK